MSRILATTLMMTLAAAAHAQRASALADPTRPPDIRPEATAAEPEGPRLQSVLISPTRRAAVISGVNVALGARYGDSTVESIIEGAVVLRYADRKETLYLIPGMGKRVRRAGAAAPPGPVVLEKGNPR
jgi:hypothetical protein